MRYFYFALSFFLSQTQLGYLHSFCRREETSLQYFLGWLQRYGTCTLPLGIVPGFCTYRFATSSLNEGKLAVFLCLETFIVVKVFAASVRISEYHQIRQFV